MTVALVKRVAMVMALRRTPPLESRTQKRRRSFSFWFWFWFWFFSRCASSKEWCSPPLGEARYWFWQPSSSSFVWVVRISVMHHYQQWHDRHQTVAAGGVEFALLLAGLSEAAMPTVFPRSRPSKRLQTCVPATRERRGLCAVHLVPCVVYHHHLRPWACSFAPSWMT